MTLVKLVASISLVIYFAALPKFLIAFWNKSGFEKSLLNLGLAALATRIIYFCLLKIEALSKNHPPGSLSGF